MSEGRRPLKTRSARWAQSLATALVRRGTSPNAISVAGAVLATLGSVALICTPFEEHWRGVLFFFGAVAVQGRLLCNMLDGMVAVEGKLQGRAGGLFNEAPDRFEDIVLLVGAGFAVGQIWLGWMAATAAVVTAHVRALGASLGQEQDFSGPLAKPQRMFFLTLGCLGAIFYSPILQWSLWLIAVGAFFTACRRVARLYRRLD